jgi:DNA polymerase-1
MLLAVDGNSLLHRAHHGRAGSDLRDSGGRPIWGLKGLVASIAAAVDRVRPDAVVVGFDCREHSVRRADHPQYKAGRPEKSEELQAQLADAPGLLAAAGFCVVVPGGYEADDVLASSAELARAQRWHCTLVTSDRDSFALLDPTTSLLRVVNGGIHGSPVMTPESLAALCGVGPGRYREFAALRGDASDNLPGVFGVGAMNAARLLAAFSSLDEVYAAFGSPREAEVAGAVGPAAAARLALPQTRADLARNLRLMAMRADLPLPDPDTMRLPLDPAVLQAVFGARNIWLGSALAALTGNGAPAVAPPPQFPRRPVPAGAVRGRARTSWAVPDQLALFPA